MDNRISCTCNIDTINPCPVHDIREGQIVSQAPRPQQTQTLLTFPDAMREVINNRKITRIDWGDTNTYGVLLDGLLMIRINNKFDRWIISDGDLVATDWITLPEGN